MSDRYYIVHPVNDELCYWTKYWWNSDISKAYKYKKGKTKRWWKDYTHIHVDDMPILLARRAVTQKPWLELLRGYP